MAAHILGSEIPASACFRRLRRLVLDQQGAVAADYGLAAALIAGAIISSLYKLGTELSLFAQPTPPI